MNGKKRGNSADVMRFVFIGLAVVLVIFLIFIMVNVYRSSVRDDVNIVIMDESEEMTDSILQSESEEEKESESEVGETETETESEKPEEEKKTEKEAESETESETQTQTEAKAQKESESEKLQLPSAFSGSGSHSSDEETESTESAPEENDTSVTQQADVSEEDNVVIVSDQAPEENYDEEWEDSQDQEYTGNYVSLSSTCYFRSEPGYEDAYGNDTIMWELPGGTVVEVLYDNGGWAEVQVDGVVGYVGSKFLAY